MLFTKVTLLLVVVAFAVAAPIEQAEITQKFAQFKTDYRKNYKPEEEPNRMKIFADNLQFIAEHNAKYHAKQVSFEVGINKFADLTNEEYKQLLGYRAPPAGTPKNGSTFLASSNTNIPESQDWRKYGYVTPVKDQGHCGSCWSFSATGSLEGQWFKKTGNLVSLSEQNLVDCSTKYHNEGCRGGWPDYAFEYIKENNGIDTENSYPYEAVDDTCRYNPANNAAHCTGKVDITKNSEDDLLTAVATVGPISVAIDASHRSFQLYKNDVYVEPQCSSTGLDHAVLVVGYGKTQDGQEYWIVKNSWSEDWGNQGYIWMARNQDNQCGIAAAASYPLV